VKRGRLTRKERFSSFRERVGEWLLRYATLESSDATPTHRAMRFLRAGSAAGFLALVIGACERAPTPVLEPDDPTAVVPELDASAHVELPSASVAMAIDAYFFQLAARYPSFAGWRLDGHGKPIVHIRPDAPEAAKEGMLTAVRRWFASDQAVDMSEVDWEMADYPYGDLHVWRNAARSLFLRNRIHSLGVRVATNRLHVGISPEPSRAEVKAELEGLGIPLTAVMLEQFVPPPPLASLTADSLTHAQRPLRGGFAISHDAGGWCTYGANVAHTSVPRGFLTASHCTPVPADAVSPAVRWFQPNAAYPQIGFEAADAKPFACMSGDWVSYDRCRHSDVALIAISDGVDWDFGSIAQTEWVGSTNGSRKISAANPKFHLVGEIYHTSEGAHVDKMGRASGWTTGRVTDNCKDYYSSQVDILFLCQVWY